MNLRVGDRVMVPRTSGKPTPGVIEHIYWDGWARIKLDQMGRRRQPIGKNIPLDELRKI